MDNKPKSALFNRRVVVYSGYQSVDVIVRDVRPDFVYFLDERSADKKTKYTRLDFNGRTSDMTTIPTDGEGDEMAIIIAEIIGKHHSDSTVYLLLGNNPKFNVVCGRLSAMFEVTVISNRAVGKNLMSIKPTLPISANKARFLVGLVGKTASRIDCIKSASDQGLLAKKNTNADYNKLAHNFVNPLMDMKLIEVTMNRKIRLTDLGVFYARLFGGFYGMVTNVVKK